MAVTTRRTSVTLDADVEATIKKMMKYHGFADSVSDYFRGLVMLDWLLIKGQAEYKAIPKWLITTYPLIFLADSRSLLQKSWVENLYPQWRTKTRAKMHQILRDGKVDLTTKELPAFEHDDENIGG
jgi:hypothetical protein